MKTTEVYDGQTIKWITGPRLVRGYIVGGYISNPFMMVGGYDKNGKIQKDIMGYNPATEKIEKMDGALQTPRYGFSVIPVKKDFC